MELSSKPIIFLFSGQGSHYYQMGRELFEKHAYFKQIMLAGEKIFIAQTGLSLLEIIYSDKHNKADIFNKTLFTHPAIFMLEYALAQTLIAENIIPDAVLGTSLGEFAAATIGGCLDFETALNYVILQAQLIEAHCQTASMTAILASLQLYQEHLLLMQNSTLASINFDQHFVITASIQELEHIEQFLKTKQLTYQRLAVSHGFHSPWIQSAELYFLNTIPALTLKNPILPMISCAEAKMLSAVPSSHLWNAIQKPILFQETIQALEKNNSYIYLDVGPSGTLATFTKYNLPPGSSSMTFATLTPFRSSVDNLLKIKNALNL